MTEVKTIRLSNLPESQTQQILKPKFTKFGMIVRFEVRDNNALIEYKNPICASHAYMQLLPYFENLHAKITYNQVSEVMEEEVKEVKQAKEGSGPTSRRPSQTEKPEAVAQTEPPVSYFQNNITTKKYFVALLLAYALYFFLVQVLIMDKYGQSLYLGGTQFSIPQDSIPAYVKRVKKVKSEPKTILIPGNLNNYEQEEQKATQGVKDEQTKINKADPNKEEKKKKELKKEEPKQEPNNQQLKKEEIRIQLKPKNKVKENTKQQKQKNTKKQEQEKQQKDAKNKKQPKRKKQDQLKNNKQKQTQVKNPIKQPKIQKTDTKNKLVEKETKEKKANKETTNPKAAQQIKQDKVEKNVNKIKDKVQVYPNLKKKNHTSIQKQKQQPKKQVNKKQKVEKQQKKEIQQKKKQDKKDPKKEPKGQKKQDQKTKKQLNKSHNLKKKQQEKQKQEKKLKKQVVDITKNIKKKPLVKNETLRNKSKNQTDNKQAKDQTKKNITQKKEDLKKKAANFNSTTFDAGKKKYKLEKNQPIKLQRGFTVKVSPKNNKKAVFKTQIPLNNQTDPIKNKILAKRIVSPVVDEKKTKEEALKPKRKHIQRQNKKLRLPKGGK